MDLTGKKVLMVVSPINFQDKEYNDSREALENVGALIKVASIQGGVAKGASETEVKIDLTVNEVNVEDFDAVAFIGGSGMVEIINDESLQVLAKKFYEAEKLTTAICVAPAILAKAGILKEKQVTSWDGAKEDLEKGGAIYTGDAVIQDEKIITGIGPEAAKEFGEKIAEALK